MPPNDFSLTPVDYDPFGGNPPDIQKEAPTIPSQGWLSRMWSGQQVARVPENQQYPSDMDAYFAREFGRGYGDLIDTYMLPGAKTKKMTADQVVEAYGDITGKAFGHAVASASTPEERNNIMKNWIAAQKSPLSALGFDPRVTITTPKEGSDLTLSGFYRPGIDTLWYYAAHPDAEVHEAMHRGIEKLRTANALPPAASVIMDDQRLAGMGEEYLVRALKEKYFGDIEKSPGADIGNRQVEAAKFYMNDWEDKDKFKAAMDALESAATAQIAKNHPRGPR